MTYFKFTINNRNTKSGFSLMEMVFSLAIIGIIAAIVIPTFTNFRNQQVIKNTTDDIVSLLNTARMQTLASKNSHFYSVHLETNRAVLFTDGTFSEPNASNVVVTFDSTVSIPATGGINLAGGGANVSFTRLTGDTDQSGTIVVQLNSNTLITKTITIKKTGVSAVN